MPNFVSALLQRGIIWAIPIAIHEFHLTWKRLKYHALSNWQQQEVGRNGSLFSEGPRQLVFIPLGDGRK